MSVLTSDKEKISEQLTKSEAAQQVLLNKKIGLKDLNTVL
jgi:hypothetical protein